METPLSAAVVEALASLTEEQQLRVIELAKSSNPNPKPSHEERVRLLDKLAGSMPKEDAEEMMAIIEEGCGKINHAAW